MVIVANARVFGGGFQVAPQADLEDGLLDAVAFANMGFGSRVARARASVARHARAPPAGQLAGGSPPRLSLLPAAGLRDRRRVEPGPRHGGRRRVGAEGAATCSCPRPMAPAAVSGGAGLREAVAAQVLSPETDAALGAAMRRSAARRATRSRRSSSSARGAAGRRVRTRSAPTTCSRSCVRTAPSTRRCARPGSPARAPPWLAVLSRWLPPTQISLRFEEPELHAKVSVMELAAFRRETSPRRHDHFTIGRLFQPSRVGPGAVGRGARPPCSRRSSRPTPRPGAGLRPWLPPAFDAESLRSQALATSMSWEVRPEPTGRAAALWAAQREAQIPILSALLAELESRGELRRLEAVAAEGGGGPSFAAVGRPGAGAALRSRLYFSRSLLRATARWAKHVLTFEDWLEYIVRKASRHTGERFELSPAGAALAASSSSGAACSAIWRTRTGKGCRRDGEHAGAGRGAGRRPLVDRRLPRRGHHGYRDADAARKGTRFLLGAGDFLLHWFMWAIGPLERTLLRARGDARPHERGRPRLRPAERGADRRRPARGRRLGDPARGRLRRPGRPAGARAAGCPPATASSSTARSTASSRPSPSWASPSTSRAGSGGR